MKVLPVGSTWALERDVLPVVLRASRPETGPDWAELMAAGTRSAAKSAAGRSTGAVAVVPLTGLLTPTGSLLSFILGGAPGGLMDFRDAFSAALRSPDVAAIVLEVDSPGGLVDQVPETAAEVHAARGKKPIVAVVNSLAGSAAYWIAAQADELVVTPSGNAGGIGVYRIHQDQSGANAQAGVDVTYIYAGRHKVDGNPDEPLADDARADWQQHVDDLCTMFVEDVARGRGVSANRVRQDYGEGRMLNAQRALAAGVVDRVATIEAVIGGLLSPGSPPNVNARAVKAAGEHERLLLALDAGITDPGAAFGAEDHNAQGGATQ